MDSLEKIIQAAKLLENFKIDRLFKEVDRIRNVFLFNSNVQKPLLNGFEFEQSFDTTLSTYRFREGDRKDQGSTVDFNFRYFYRYKFKILFICYLFIN